MPWQEVSTMSLRKEFIMLASQSCANISELCRRFGISRKTAYKWLGRYGKTGDEGLQDRSRRPHRSSNRTPEPMEQLALSMRDAHPAWGGRKIKRRLEDLGHEALPSASTLTEVLRRNGRLNEAESAKHKAWQRCAEPPLADGFQRPFCDERRTLPCLDRARRSFPLFVAP